MLGLLTQKCHREEITLPTIYVVGLGPGDLSGLPMGTYQRLKSGLPVYFRTEIHPAAEQLRAEGLAFQSFDGLYEQEENFNAVYQTIAKQLWESALSGGDLIFAVPGHPLMAEQSVQNLLEMAANSPQVKVEIGPGQSFFDAVCTVLGIDPIQGLLLIDGTQLDPSQLRPDKHTLVAQVFSPAVASDVKLTLMELYPDDYLVTVVRAAGVPGQERIIPVPLYELDRVGEVNHLTTVYIPPADNPHILSTQGWYLEKLVSRLRAPGGCPWDRDQTHQSLRKYMIEEAYEAVHAIDADDPDELAAELGDVLLQILLHAQIASEFGDFNLSDVFRSLGDKLIRRHPHVFGEATAANDVEAEAHWREAKAAERPPEAEQSILDSVPDGQPSWKIAAELQKRAAEVGFDWPAIEDVYDKLKEEVAEFGAELGKNQPELLLNELGDILFVIVNVLRWLDLDLEEALSRTNYKFVRRFGHVEQCVKERGGWAKHSLADLDAYWDEAKGMEEYPKKIT